VARLYIDEDISPKVAVQLRILGHDAVATQDVGRKGAGDDDQLLFAAQQQRLLVALNVRDFSLLQDAWMRWSHAWQASHPTATHAGVVVLRPGLVTDLVSEIEGFLSSPRPLANLMYRRTQVGWQVRHIGTWQPSA
jgi:hypothetical protein